MSRNTQELYLSVLTNKSIMSSVEQDKQMIFAAWADRRPTVHWACEAWRPLWFAVAVVGGQCGVSCAIIRTAAWCAPSCRPAVQSEYITVRHAGGPTPTASISLLKHTRCLQLQRHFVTLQSAVYLPGRQGGSFSATPSLTKGTASLHRYAIQGSCCVRLCLVVFMFSGCA